MEFPHTILKPCSTRLFTPFPLTLNKVNVPPVFTHSVNYRSVSVMLAIYRFCEDIFHTFIKDWPTKNDRCPVFRVYRFSKGLHRRNIEEAARDLINRRYWEGAGLEGCRNWEVSLYTNNEFIKNTIAYHTVSYITI